MNETFIPPELQEVLAGTLGDGKPLVSESGILSIGDDRYAVTLPDGSQVIVDRSGNIVG